MVDFAQHYGRFELIRSKNDKSNQSVNKKSLKFGYFE